MTESKSIPTMPAALSIDATELRDVLKVVAYRLSRSPDRSLDGLRIAATDLMIRTDHACGTFVVVSPSILSQILEFAGRPE